MSLKWTKSNIMGHETIIDGFKVSRVKLNGWSNKAFHYYVHWIQYPHYSAPHFKMSHYMRSVAQCKAFIKNLMVDGSSVGITLYNEFKPILVKLHNDWLNNIYSDDQYEFNRNLICKAYGIKVLAESVRYERVYPGVRSLTE